MFAQQSVCHLAVIGYFVKERLTLGVPLMDQWINHDNMWLRRVAILHQVSVQYVITITGQIHGLLLLCRYVSM